MITISGTGDAAGQTTGQISQVIQTMLAAQLVGKGGALDMNQMPELNGNGAAK